MSKSSCSIEGCERQVKAKGLCATHYARLLRGTDLTIALRAAVGTPKPRCSVDHCSNLADSTLAAAVCAAHRTLASRGRSHPKVGRPFAMKRCGMPGCTRKYLASGMCANHNQRAYKYGLSVIQMDQLLATHTECDICEAPITPETAHIDHDHSCCEGRISCGKCVRGVLCSPCNVGLGAFRDSTSRLHAAALYLAA